MEAKGQVVKVVAEAEVVVEAEVEVEVEAEVEAEAEAEAEVEAEVVVVVVGVLEVSLLVALQILEDEFLPQPHHLLRRQTPQPFLHNLAHQPLLPLLLLRFRHLPLDPLQRRSQFCLFHSQKKSHRGM